MIVRFCLKIGLKMVVSPKTCLKIVLRSSVTLDPGSDKPGSNKRGVRLTVL